MGRGRSYVRAAWGAAALVTATTLALLVPWTASGPSGAGLVRRLSLDLTAPSVQVFPRTVAAADAATGLSWTEVCPFDLASGSVTCAAGTVLTATGAPRYAMTTPLWDGSSMLATKGVEFRGVTDADRFEGATSTWDLSTSTTIVAAVAVARPSTGPNRSFFQKRASLITASAGYNLFWVGSFAIVAANISDGTTEVLVNGPGVADPLDGPGSGAVQFVALQMNVTSGKARIYAYRTVGSDYTMPAGTKTNASKFLIGGFPGVLFDHEGSKLLWLGVLRGAAAEAFALGDLNELDNISRAPSIFVAYQRQSVVSPRVAYEPGFGVRVQHLAGSATTTSLIHFAHIYHPSATRSPQQLAAYFARATSVAGPNKRNLLLQSDDLSSATWTKTNVTATKNVAEDPAGFTAAAQLTATAGNAIVSQATATTANLPYAWSVYVRRAGASDVALKLRSVDTAGPTTIHVTDHTATSEWTRIVLDCTSVTATNRRLELEIVPNGGSIYATFGQHEYGWLTEYQHQRASLINRDDMDVSISNAGGLYYRAIAGFVRTVVVQYVDNIAEDAYVFSTGNSSGVTNSDRLLMQTSDYSGSAGGEPYDLDIQHHVSNGDYVAQINAPNIDRAGEVAYEYRWDSRRRTQNATYAWCRQGERAADAAGALVPTAPWSSSVADPTTLHPGNRVTNTAQLEGGVEYLEIWGPP